ncbi:MAG: hypothetical protein WDW38_007853 [Sanguina aurantia]
MKMARMEVSNLREKASSPDSHAFVTWDANASPPRCDPDVCDGATLTDLRDLDGKASVAQICAGPLYDSKRTRACLKDRPLLFLGDSTTHEMVMDVISLVVNFAHNDSSFFDFTDVMITYKTGRTEPLYTLPGGSEISFYGGIHSHGRNFTYSLASESIQLKFRFMGHHNVSRDVGGIATFFHPLVMLELLCELAVTPPEGNNCSTPYAVIVNTGQHDVGYLWNNIPEQQRIPYFTAYLDLLLKLLGPHNLAFLEATPIEAGANGTVKGGITGRVTPYKVP